MINMNSINRIHNVSFQSKIRLVNKSEFNKFVSSYEKQHFVDFPWTVQESVISDKAYTRGVSDCTVCGINDGLKVLMFHISPTIRENDDFRKIRGLIKRTFDLKDKNLQGFIFGSKNIKGMLPQSKINFEKFEKILKNIGIPYSKIKSGPYTNDLAYSSKTDEWVVSFNMLEDESVKEDFKEPVKFLDRYFDEVEINPLDELSW